MKHMSWSYRDLQDAPERLVWRLGVLLQKEFGDRAREEQRHRRK